ncbi:MAG: hypothetical protein K2X52_10110 [Mycobacteriaceae bacterium]|nr:hypothetical protein [Mycobacteriaceae bacterium]
MTATRGNCSRFDDLAALLFHPAADEVERVLGSGMDYEDLTPCELVTMANILRTAWDRKQARLNPPVVLKMARNRSR